MELKVLLVLIVIMASITGCTASVPLKNAPPGNTRGVSAPGLKTNETIHPKNQSQLQQGELRLNQDRIKSETELLNGQEQLRLEREKLDAERKQFNAAIWNNFVNANPLFADANSKQRKYGDYLFDATYNTKMASGELTYQQALDRVAYETYLVVGGQQPIAPEVLAPLPVR